MALALGLLRLQPLQGEGIRRRRVADDNLRRVGGHLDAQGRSQVIRRVADREGSGCKTIAAPGTNGFDSEFTRVEHQQVVGLVQALQVQPRLTLEHLAFEVDGEVEVDVGRSVVVRVRERMVVNSGRRRGYWCRPDLRPVRPAQFHLLRLGFRAGSEQRKNTERQVLPKCLLRHQYLCRNENGA